MNLGSTWVTPRKFEVALVLAAVIETTFLCLIFDRREAADGLWLALLFTFIVPWIPFALGLAVTRRGSRLAAIIFLCLVALAWVTGIRGGTTKWAADPVLIIGAIATIVQTAAALILLTPIGWRWLQNGRRSDR